MLFNTPRHTVLSQFTTNVYVGVSADATKTLQEIMEHNWKNYHAYYDVDNKHE
jgi:microcystin degradation protein MlrC